mgnify:CR=1 FL=1
MRFWEAMRAVEDGSKVRRLDWVESVRYAYLDSTKMVKV